MAEAKDYLCTRCLSSFHSDVSDSAPSTQQSIQSNTTEHEQGSSQEENSSPKPKQPKLPPCQYCLDLLDSAHQQSIIDHVVHKLTQENYTGLSTFQLCVSIPQSLVLQQGIIAIHYIKATPTYGSSFDFVKDNFKYELMKALEVRLSLKVIKDSPFKISLVLTHPKANSTYQSLAKKRKPISDKKRKPKFVYTHELVQKTLDTVTKQELEQESLLPVLPLLETHCTMDVTFSHEPLYLAGRYNKFSRNLSQSPWIIDGIKKAETSVQEILVFHTEKVFHSDSIVFSSSGREDVDVRMLGTGRPFMLEVVNPRVLTFDECLQLEVGINKSTNDMSVRNLKLVDRQIAGTILKSGEEEKEKHYSALIWSSCELLSSDLTFLDKITNLSIKQKTPIRVLHRRSLATRERVIYTLKATLVDSHHFQLDLSTQAGTYIKEFVHGDFGRTVPNLSQLMGHTVDILALDVTEIKLEWPPP